MLGLTQGDIAEQFGVAPYTVKRWERDDCENYEAPDKVWEFYQEALVNMYNDATYMADCMANAAEIYPDQLPVTIAYYRTQEDYERFANVPGFQGKTYTYINAISRIAAFLLYDMDIPFEFVYKAKPMTHVIVDEDGNVEEYNA